MRSKFSREKQALAAYILPLAGPYPERRRAISRTPEHTIYSQGTNNLARVLRILFPQKLRARRKGASHTTYLAFDQSKSTGQNRNRPILRCHSRPKAHFQFLNL